MTDFSGYTTMRYYKVPFYLDLILYFLIISSILALVGIAIGVIKTYKSSGKFPGKDQFKDFKVMIPFGLCLIGAYTFIHMHDDRYLIFDETKISIVDVSESKYSRIQNIVDSAYFSELTPYFEYYSGSGKYSQDEYRILFKREDGVVFTMIRAERLTSLIEQYTKIHERNPDLIDRMSCYKDCYKIDKFLSKLDEKNR